jgi:hypothetical protein
MAEEKPFIEKPEDPEIKSEEIETETVDVDALMGTLEKFNVKPDQLQGKLQNAQDYSMVRSERDLLANEMQSLRQDFDKLKNQAPQTQSNYDYDDVPESRPIDIESALENAVDKVISKREKAAMDRQMQMNAQWTKITGHKNYHLVKDEFEEALRDPATVMKIQTGQVDAFEFYTDMVLDKYAGITKQSIDAFKQIKGSSGVAPPHVETGARAPRAGEAPKDKTDNQKKARSLVEKAKKGRPLSDTEIEDAVGLFMGDLGR